MEKEILEIPIWFLPDFINAQNGDFVISFEFKNNNGGGPTDAEK